MRRSDGMFDGHLPARCLEVIEDDLGPARRCVLEEGHNGNCVPSENACALHVDGAMQKEFPDDSDEKREFGMYHGYATGPPIATVDDLITDILGEDCV